MTDKSTTNRIVCPLAIPTLSFIVGIASGRLGFVLPVSSVYFALIISLSVVVYLLKNRLQSRVQSLSIALAFIAVGNAHIAGVPPLSLDNPLTTIVNSGNDAVFSGIIRTAPSFNGRRGKFVVDVDQLRTDDGPLIPTKTRVLLKTSFPPPRSLVPGAQILVRASLSIPSPPTTPGSFNYQQYLIDRHIPLTGFIRSPAYLQPLPDNQSTSSRYLPQYLRYRANLFIDGTDLPLKIKALYKALITGQRDSLPTKVLVNFKRSGTVHLLAISGMHMGLLALLSGLLINGLLRSSSWLLLRWPVWKISAVLTLLIMGLYATISGLQPPVVRAFIMAAMLIIAIVIDRPRSLLNTMALAALLILLYEPTALFSASFQLSFIAVAGIIIFTSQFPELFRHANSSQTTISGLNLWLRTGITISLVALWATAPITLYHFHQVSLLGPLTTLLVAPLLCFWALPFGLSATLISPWLPNLASDLLSLGAWGLSGSDLITATAAAIPYTFYFLPPPPIIVIAAYYLLAGYLLFRRTCRSTTIIIAATMLFLIGMPMGGLLRGKDAPSRVTFLDVGQGSATLLELPGEINILVDGGGSSSPGFNPGEQRIGPFLWHQSINRLSALIISHVHHDHYNGLEFIIRNFKPAEIWINGAEETSKEYRDILAAAAAIGAKIMIPEAGTIITDGGAAKLTSISNLHLRENKDLPANSRSLAIRLEIAGHKIILPGDILADDGQILIDQGVDLQSDVLLAPHHGSEYSAGYHLVKEGKPDWLIVSSSSFKSGNFPDPEFASWCRKQGVSILNTAEHGTITFTFTDKGTIHWSAFRKNRAHKATETEPY